MNTRISCSAKGIGLLAGLLLGLPAARVLAQDPTCPLDEAPITAREPRPINAAGGRDSDGCTYAVDGQGRWWVPALTEVRRCGRCGVAFDLTHLRSPQPGAGGAPAAGWAGLSGDERTAVTAAVAAVDSSLPPLAQTQLAAWAAFAALPVVRQRALAGPAGPASERAFLLLRAAWACRALAVLSGPVEPYRPRDVTQAGQLLRELEQTARGGGQRTPLEAALGRLVAGYRGLEALLADERLEPERRLLLIESLHQLQSLEQRLLLTRSREGPARAAGPSSGSLACARACLRFGDPRRREEWSELARAELGPRGAALLADLERSAAAEARLLERAEAAWLEAAAAPGLAPDERARCQYLAAAAARRRGATTWRQRLDEAARAAPGSPGSRAAEALRTAGAPR